MPLSYQKEMDMGTYGLLRQHAFLSEEGKEGRECQTMEEGGTRKDRTHG